MSAFASTKARRVYTALERIVWALKRQTGSHRVLAYEGWPNYVFAFHDGEEIGPSMLRRIGQHTALAHDDLRAARCPTLIFC